MITNKKGAFGVVLILSAWLQSSALFGQSLKTIFESVRNKDFEQAQALLIKTKEDCGFFGCKDFEVMNEKGKLENISREEIGSDIRSLEKQLGSCEEKYEKFVGKQNSWWFETNCGPGSPFARLLIRTSAYSGVDLKSAYPDFVKLAEARIQESEAKKKSDLSARKQKELQKRQFEDSPTGIAKSICEWRQTKTFYENQLARQKKIEKIGGVANLGAKRQLAEGIALADEAIEHQASEYRKKAKTDWSWKNCN